MSKAWRNLRYCAGCEGTMHPNDTRRVRYGPFLAHQGCTVTCALCEKTIEPPKVGSQYMIVAHCGAPAHRECKP